MNHIVSAVFDSHAEAERAVSELRNMGVRDSALSVIARRDSGNGDYGDANTEEAKDKGEGFVKGALSGAGVGALLGIAALAIPGVGPLAAAGAIAGSAIPEAAAIGAGAGALAGGLTGMLTKHGVSEDDARYYESRINDGGVFVSVDTSDAGVSPEAASDILHRYGGHSSTRSKLTTSGTTGESSAFGFGDDPNPGPVDRLENVIEGRDDPNRGPVDRLQNALDGRDDPNRGPVDRLQNALDGHDDPDRGPIDRIDKALDRR